MKIPSKIAFLALIFLSILISTQLFAQFSTQNDADTSTTICTDFYNRCYQYNRNRLWLASYDSSKQLVETCPNYAQSWRAFTLMSTSVQNLYSLADTGIWLRYRNWLKSVLYLNTAQPEYFCACVEAIGNTYHSPLDTTGGELSRATNTPLAVLQWMIEHTNCDTAMLRRNYQGGRELQLHNWLNDTTAYPLDTTLPSMHDLGLDSLLQIHLRMSVSQPTLFTSILQAFSLSENPFQSNTMVRFNLNSMAYVRTEVYDEFGRMVIGDGSGKVYESGPHQLPIDLSKFASGAYYLRISLADGEARTLKMVKQE